jgi:hypothetical protein
VITTTTNFHNKLISKYYPNASTEERQKIEQYLIDNVPSEKDKQEYLYMNKPGCLYANDIINALSYKEFHRPEWNGLYQGNRCMCGECKYFKYDMEFIHTDKDNTEIIYHSNCKTIDHNKIKLPHAYFKTYGSAMESCDVCNHFEPAEWNLSGQREWKGIEAYIEYMDKEWYDHWEWQESRLDTRTKGLLYKGNEYYVTLRDWLNGDAVKDNKIKHKRWTEIIYMTNKEKYIEHDEEGSIEVV